ncbi:hypothetical protein, partial [Enterococcus faecium]|uniref:hypothetical protein n=1 Tax=Enterococcus faecium TaxID=1352 RepID=UPI0039082F13
QGSERAAEDDGNSGNCQDTDDRQTDAEPNDCAPDVVLHTGRRGGHDSLERARRLTGLSR